MARSLIALGSNLGDRAATLDAALVSLSNSPGYRLVAASQWLASEPVGTADTGGEFLNGAAVIETQHTAYDLHDLLQKIEAAHGRTRRMRWEARTLDLDLLLYDQQTFSTQTLTLPHPRMSFRRFVLDPAAVIAGDWMHPTIGWTLEELRAHLDAGADFIAIVSPSEEARRELTTAQSQRPEISASEAPLADPRWPPSRTTWLAVAPDSSGPTRPVSALPKLSIVLDPPTEGDSAWREVAEQLGRGPTLRISATCAELLQEVSAAVAAVWPRLGRSGAGRLQ
jgi:2-amino-4-hydroxy-6-hydroxymethyldihydropteridine diphosphokinase